MRNHISVRARKEFGRQVKVELEKLDKPYKWLAGKAGCSEKTVRNVVEGKKTSGKTIAKVSGSLGVDVGGPQSTDVADESHGGYTLANMADYIGQFYAYRWRFSHPAQIIRSTFEIGWDKSAGVLRFEESQCYDCSSDEGDAQKDYSQKGHVFLSNEIGLLHFVTAFRGAIRLITCFKYRLNNENDLILRGVVLTQAKLEIGYQPSTTAIILEKTNDPNFAQEKTKVLILKPGDPDYERIYRELLDVEKDGVKITLAPEPQILLSGLDNGATESTKAA
jgi:hypothetical protein